MTREPSLNADVVVEAIREELVAPSEASSPPTSADDSQETPRDSFLLAELRRLTAAQRAFREAPVGGRLVGLKRMAHWFVASAFDRQAKVVEGLLATLSAQEQHRLHDESRAREAVSEPVSALRRNRRRLPRRLFTTASEWNRAPASLEAALAVDAQMEYPEKLLLYSLVFGSKPERVLEIGTFQGGSTAIISAALDDSGFGRIFCVDPEPRVSDERRAALERADILKGFSPDAIAEAYERAGGRFDLALIDGDHTFDGVVRDIEGVMPYLSNGALLLFHDSHYWEVAEAIDEVVSRRWPSLTDIGDLSLLCNPVTEAASGDVPVVWGGIRVLRFSENGSAS